MFNSKLPILSLSMMVIFSFSACSQKNTQLGECGEKTVLQGTAVGTVLGAVAGKLSQTNIFLGAIVGGVVGTVGSRYLASLQCQYYGKERVLLEQITENIEEQNSLANSTNNLNKRMSTLYNEIETLKHQKYLQASQKENLLNKIKIKREEIRSLQRLNSEVMQSTKTYYASVKAAKFSKADKESVQHSLNSIFSSLTHIEKASQYNLKQLEKFERRVLQ